MLISMNAGVILFILFYAAFFFTMYIVVKAAVRDGIFEARHRETAVKSDSIAEITCPGCGKSHEMDYPKCPYCGYVHFSL